MKIKILGTTATIKSDIKIKDIELLEKFKPEALVLKNEKGNEVFRVAYGEGISNNHGITFNENIKGYAGISLCNDAIDISKDDVKKSLVEFLAPIQVNLQKITEQINTVAPAIRKTNKELEDIIEFVDFDEEEE